jgi:hypothetical protein
VYYKIDVGGNLRTHNAFTPTNLDEFATHDTNIKSVQLLAISNIHISTEDVVNVGISIIFARLTH